MFSPVYQADAVFSNPNIDGSQKSHIYTLFFFFSSIKENDGYVMKLLYFVGKYIRI